VFVTLLLDPNRPLGPVPGLLAVAVMLWLMMLLMDLVGSGDRHVNSGGRPRSALCWMTRARPRS